MVHKSGNPEWKNYPNTQTPLNAEALERIETAIDDSILADDTDSLVAAAIQDPQSDTRGELDTRYQDAHTLDQDVTDLIEDEVSMTQQALDGRFMKPSQLDAWSAGLVESANTELRVALDANYVRVADPEMNVDITEGASPAVTSIATYNFLNGLVEVNFQGGHQNTTPPQEYVIGVLPPHRRPVSDIIFTALFILGPEGVTAPMCMIPAETGKITIWGDPGSSLLQGRTIFLIPPTS